MRVDHISNKVPDLFYSTDSQENLMNAAVTLDLSVSAQIHDQCTLILLYFIVSVNYFKHFIHVMVKLAF